MQMDSTRWNGFPFRDDDIVIATWQKSGTTWMQQIVSQLIFRGADSIAVDRISPWLECTLYPPEILQALEAQTHRRFIKTHLPLDALAFSPRAKYIYVARDGRDTVWSAYNQTVSAKQEIRAAARGSGQAVPAPALADRVEYFRFWLKGGGAIFGDFWSHQQQWWDVRRAAQSSARSLQQPEVRSTRGNAPDRRFPRHRDPSRALACAGGTLHVRLHEEERVRACPDDRRILRAAAGAGAPIPKAPVQAKNLDTNETFKTTSASDGSYNLSGLSPGGYEISVENVAFFRPFHQSGVQAADAKNTRLDIRLDDFQLNTLGDSGEQFVVALGDHPTPSGPAPRTSDGKPDLSGVWQELFNAKPLGGDPQPLPEAEAASKQRGKRGRITDLGTRGCLPGGIVPFGSPDYPYYRIVQTPSLLVILDGGFNPDRQIYLDGRGHPKDFNPSWMGHSIGHWEGDTLVVDTVGFNDLGWISGGRVLFPQTENLHITERFRRLDLGHLEVERTFADPTYLKQPFTTTEVHPLAPKDVDVLEYVCAENERDLAHTKSDQ